MVLTRAAVEWRVGKLTVMELAKDPGNSGLNFPWESLGCSHVGNKAFTQQSSLDQHKRIQLSEDSGRDCPGNVQMLEVNMADLRNELTSGDDLVDGPETGTVIKWFPDKGFGFIKPKGVGDSIFCHKSHLAHGEGSVNQGDLVSYVSHFNDGKGKMEALNVKKVEVSCSLPSSSSELHGATKTIRLRLRKGKHVKSVCAPIDVTVQQILNKYAEPGSWELQLYPSEDDESLSWDLRLCDLNVLEPIELLIVENVFR